MEDGPEPGKEFVVAERAVIGRLPGNEVSLPADENVSRRHARLYRAGGGYEIVDLGSANGTSVNGAKIGASYLLRTGDRVKVGGTTLRFVEEAGGAAPSVAPARPAASAPTRSGDVIAVRGAAAESAPAAGAAAERSPAAVSVVVKNETLQFSPYKDSGAASALREDLGQRSALFRAVVVLVALAAAAALFFAVRSLTMRTVARKSEEPAREDPAEPR